MMPAGEPQVKPFASIEKAIAAVRKTSGPVMIYLSATGMNDTTGVLVVEVTPGSAAAKFLQTNDVILLFNNKKVNKLRDLLEARMSVTGSGTKALIFRNQKEMKVHVELN
jgi:S1-C subfamily serine protease